MRLHVLCTFACVSVASAASPAPTPIKESTKGGGRRRRPPPFVEAARSAASFMDGCVGAGEAADAAETHVNVRRTCTCMHTLRATSDPHGHHGRAQSTGQGFFVRFYEDKKDAQRPYDHFAEGIAPRSLLCVWKRTLWFLQYSAPVFVRPSWSEFIQILRGVIPPQLERSFNY